MVIIFTASANGWNNPFGPTRFGPILAGSTLDYAVIGSEHGSRDRTELQALAGMLRAADVTPIIRVPIPKSEWVAMALDAGHRPEFPPRDAPWGERYFHVRDPDGHELSFARPL